LARRPRRPHRREQLEHGEEPMNGKSKILVVDDDRRLLDALAIFLDKHGYMVSTAADGHEGWQHFVQLRSDLVVLDIMMPGMDGWEICKRLRTDSRTKYIPVIMLTALDQTEDLVKGFEAGADDYLAKPFDNAELFARIKSVLTKASKGLAIDPLTRLPGKHQIYEHTRRRLEQRGKFFAFLYIDISNLRFINDNYGIEQGDRVIKSVADILRDIVNDEEEFLGYMGEDDFVVLSVPLRVQQIFSSLSDRFDQAISDICPDLPGVKKGEEVCPIKIAVAVVTNEKRQFGDPLQIKNVALEVLKKARVQPAHYCADLKDNPV
jgi:diguanylate cyclase (GGDEF)-like protein